MHLKHKPTGSRPSSDSWRIQRPLRDGGSPSHLQGVETEMTARNPAGSVLGETALAVDSEEEESTVG